MSNYHTKKATKSLPVFIVAAYILCFVGLIIFTTKRETSISRKFNASGNSTIFSSIQLQYRPSAIAFNGLDSLYIVTDLKLIKINLITGKEIWSISDMAFWGTESILVEEDRIYLTSSTNLSAVDINQHKIIWSTSLGLGHVDFFSQIDGQIIRVYYGGVIFDLWANDGRILHKYPRGNIEWKADEIEYKRVNNLQLLQGYDPNSNSVIWETPLDFLVDQPLYFLPIDTGEFLLLRTSNASLCLVQKQTGSVLWCQNATYLSNIGYAVNQGVVFLLRNDFVLIGIDLSTGETKKVGSFSPTILPSEMQHTTYIYNVMMGNGIVAIYFEDSSEVFWGSVTKFIKAP